MTMVRNVPSGKPGVLIGGRCVRSIFLRIASRAATLPVGSINGSQVWRCSCKKRKRRASSLFMSLFLLLPETSRKLALGFFFGLPPPGQKERPRRASESEPLAAGYLFASR
jgi:hypothetical protein